jgi:hexosaminidase
MTLTFAARIEGGEIHCEIGTDTALHGVVWCFSVMTPADVLSGGQKIRGVAGYTEVALPDIAAGATHRVVIAPERRDFVPRNRAWLPLGSYLRLKTGLVQLPKLKTGVRYDAPPPRVAPLPKGLRLLPQPASWRGSGASVAVTAFHSRDPAAGLVAALAERLNFAPFLAPGGLPVSVTIDAVLEPEAYRLTISPDGVQLDVAGNAGAFRGFTTLLALRETYEGLLPCGTITDAPRFGWRGQHLDCSRHFFSITTILRLLDLMALVKLNRFHWHFNDDESFRLEVDCAPELWQKTAIRGEGQLIPGVWGGGIRAGGSYSKADVARVLARARELEIEVLPEVEVPAHAHAMNAAHPGMHDPGDNARVESVHGFTENVLNPAMPETWDLLQPLLLEVAELFPIGILHLGCDELPGGSWESSPAVAALKAREGLTTRDDVQGWMMARLAGHLQAHGIRSAAWEEAARGSNGGIGHGAMLFSWTGQGPGVEAARAGYDVVMCPAQNIYFDMAHTSDPEDWGAGWAAYVGLEDVMAWRPVPKGAEDVADRIVGVEGCFWGEFTTEDAEMEPMLAPRILGMANKAWDRNDSVTGPDLRGLAQVWAPLFDRMGWQRHGGA